MTGIMRWLQMRTAPRQKYLPKAKYFWTSYTFKDDADVSKVGTFEYNNFPTYSTKTGGSYDLAIPVRCVK